MVQTKKKRDVKRTIIIIFGLVLMFLGGKIIPTWGPMTEMGVAMVCAFVGLIILISGTNDTIWPSCAAVIAIIAWGYLDQNTAIANFTGTVVIVQMLALLVICSGLRETGAGQIIAKKFLSMKAIQGKPLAFTMLFLLAFLIADILLTTFGGFLFSCAVLDNIAEVLGYKKNHKYIQAMSVGLFIVSMIGASILPFGGMVLVITNAFGTALANYGLAFSQPIYLICVIPVTIVFTIGYALFIKYVMKCDMSALKDLKIEEVESLKAVPSKFNARQICYIVAFFIAIIYSFLLLLIPQTVSWYPWFSSIGQATWFLLVVVLLAIFKVDGKPLLDCEKHFKDGVMWSSIVTVGAFSMLGGALSSNDLGFKTWLIDVIGPMFSNMPFPLFMLLVITICTIVTNFFSNMATGVIVATLTAPFVAAYAANGINASVIGSAIALSSMFAYLTYAACGPAPLLLTREGIETKFIYSHSLWSLPIFIVVGTVLFTVFAYIL